MATYFTIPLSGNPEAFRITLGAKDYRLRVMYRNVDEGGWVLDIADANDNPIVNGIPLVTGADLLAQYPHFGFGGSLWAQTIQNPDAVPTFENLGSEALLYWVTA